MLATTALKNAGPGAVLAARPHGVLHVVPLGPLTPGGDAIPRRRRPVCKTATRRLYVQPSALSLMSLGEHVTGRRLCRKCSTRLVRRPAVGSPPAGRVEPSTGRYPTRDDYQAAYADVDELDLWLAYLLAETDAEVERCCYIAAVRFDKTLPAPVELPNGATWTRQAFRNAGFRVERDYELILDEPPQVA